MATTSRTELYEEIDLRPYIEALLRSWMWIVGAAVAVAIATFFLTSLETPTYQATALVAVTKPRFNIQLDPRFQTIEDLGVAYGAYEQIALSDELIAELYESVPAVPEGVDNVQEFGRMLDVTIGSNETLVELTVITVDAKLAAEIANQWADLVIKRSNELYGNYGDESVNFLEAQLVDAETDLTTAETNLITFAAQDQKGMLENELAVLINDQKIYLETQTMVESLAWNVAAFRDSLARVNENTPLSKADQLTALTLQARVFDAQSESIQIDVSTTENLLEGGRAELIADLDSWILILEERAKAFDQLMIDTSPRILDVQGTIGQLLVERDRLERELERTRDTKDLLTQSLAESHIASQDVGNQIKLAAKAVTPDRPMPSGSLFVTLGAMFGVGIFVVALIIVREWWSRKPTAA